MDDAIQQRVIEALQGCGADEVTSTTRWVATFGDRRVEVTLYDLGPLFAKRYLAKALDEASLEVVGEQAHTVTGAVGSIPWGELLLG